MDCIFCKIASGEIPSSMVYEDEKVAAFRDLSPVAPQHILVVPKKHYDSLEDIPMDEMDIISDIHRAIRKIAEQEGFNEDGYRIINNCGKNGGQEVPHIHYHLLAGKKLTKLVVD
ncbi:histidine triad nucleotide-binding protein [Peptostreptococcus equinus]|uniref:Histidine triad nucleotide-binding protein n=1 Tax=Peptostreptococcus equinus TaxID=3003601 RepID=A0ABY7JLF4_9FIRM|nr:histidine triad nucleotide-binding protein [Peptostreptococcus sp. CBA3647]WAW14185.1 histidine triad nucleotide-binding protein [Peptostreptococcus sp. CBA3647]